MRIVRFSNQGKISWGVYHQQDQLLTPLGHIWAQHTEALLQKDEDLKRLVEKYRSLDIPIQDLVFLPPVTPSNKIFCVGLNYGRHVLESGRDLPSHPSLFLRHLDSFVGHKERIIKPSVSEQFDYEGELVVVIGRTGRHIKEEDAWQHVAGYTCMAENSVRDFQNHTAQVTAGKNFDQSGGIGPWILSARSIEPGSSLRIQTRLNNVAVQDDSTKDFIFSIPRLIAYISTFTELKAGDLIATGTPEGVGMRRTPPLYMQENDVLEVEIEQVGLLKLFVSGESY